MNDLAVNLSYNIEITSVELAEILNIEHFTAIRSIEERLVPRIKATENEISTTLCRLKLHQKTN